MEYRESIARMLDALPVAVRVEGLGTPLGPADAAVRLRIQGRRGALALASRAIGDFASAYVEGEVEIEGTMRDLMRATAALVGASPREAAPGVSARWVAAAASALRHGLRRDAAQIRFHYDVSDAFYALWLDPARVYSCAYFADPEASLAEAQQAKLELICRKLQLAPGMRLLDIGCGWGALILHAAERHGVEAVGITLSENQHAHVRREIERRGLAGRVEVRLEDYRVTSAARPYDRVASVGMFEHVGRANMTLYCERLRALLVPGGRVLNHGITAATPDSRGLGGGIGDFIERYIFPGGELLHASAIFEHMARGGLEVVDVENLRPHYARTLWHWSDGLEARLPEAKAALRERHPAERAERILRAYRLYLAGSALGFELGWMAIHQFLAIRPDDDPDHGELRGAQSDYPFRRDFMYRG
jgi:cyclopropane-fatty-acyl-phospholipid synthase